MGILWKNNILWWRKNTNWRFNLMIEGNFSLEINSCFFICSDLARSCRWNSTSWAKSWIFCFMVGNKPIRIFFFGL